MISHHSYAQPLLFLGLKWDIMAHFVALPEDKRTVLSASAANLFAKHSVAGICTDSLDRPILWPWWCLKHGLTLFHSVLCVLLIQTSFSLFQYLFTLLGCPSRALMVGMFSVLLPKHLVPLSLLRPPPSMPPKRLGGGVGVLAELQTVGTPWDQNISMSWNTGPFN